MGSVFGVPFLNPPSITLRATGSEAIVTQLATNEFYTFEEPFSAHSSPQKGDMSIENGVFNPSHSSGVLCV